MRRIKAAAAALALLFGLSSAAVSAAQVLRTEIKMPALQLQIGSEADLSALTPADVKATLDGSPLTTASFAKNEDGVLYLVVLDISGSMPDGHFDAAKTAAAALFDGLRPQDKLRLYACGSKVRTVLEGGEDADTAKAAIEALRKGGSTLLYDAVETLLADAAAADGRVAAAFISDGADSGRSSVTAEQLKNDLAASGLAPAAFCVDSASADDADAVGVYRGIIEGASGSFAEFDAESIGPALASWAAQAQNVYDLQLTAASNLADGSEHALAVDFGGRDQLETKVTPTDWTPDTTAPTVTGLARGEDGTVTVTYSEPVSGADNTAAYTLTAADGSAVALSAAAADSATQYRLTPSAALPAGALTLAISGVSDLSMEKNPLAAYSGAIAPVSGAAPSSASAAAATAAAGLPALPVLAGGAAALLVILLLVLLAVRRRKRQKAAPSAAAADAPAGGRRAQKPAKQPRPSKAAKLPKGAATQTRFYFEEHRDDDK